MRGSKMKGGPGSRGGKVVGMTKGGRVIYAKLGALHEHPELHKALTKKDHHEAVAAVVEKHHGKKTSSELFRAAHTHDVMAGRHASVTSEHKTHKALHEAYLSLAEKKNLNRPDRRYLRG